MTSINWIKISDCNTNEIPRYEDLLVYPFPTDYIFTATYGMLPNLKNYYGWAYHEQTPYGVESTIYYPTHYAVINKPEDEYDNN